MENNPARPQNMIDTTDALEAASTCQSMKNFLFVLILLGLMVCQIIFWMNHFGLVDKNGCSACQSACQKTCPQKECSKSQPQAAAVRLISAPIFLAAEVESAPAEAEPAKPIEQAVNDLVESANQTQPDKEILLEKDTDRIPAEIPTEDATPEMLNPEASPEEAEEAEQAVAIDKMALFRISCRFATIAVTICNYIILTAAMLYSLSLLICLKISLTGRLGGINHIARAFFISLFLLVVLIPWQTVLPGVLVGALWQPSAMCGWAKAETSMFWKILFYGRFCGLWFVAIWLLLWVQTRSAKWARATLRRLGVVR